MPIETSPIPFGNLHLPYTPLFDPVGGDVAPNGTIIGGGGGGSGAPLAHGPASVAASAIIGPTPGGVAGPHHAIPALPDAGYTAPTIRAASLTGYPPNICPQGGYHPGGGGREEYAGGSMYGPSSPQHPPLGVYDNHHGPIHHHHHHPHTDTAGSTYSDGWSASLPAPRRAPIVPPLQASEQPRGRAHDRSPATHLSPLRTKHHHPPRNHEADFDDGASDASYYAMPRKNGHHRSSSHGSSASESPSPGLGPRHDRDDLHRRTVSTNHHRRPRSSSIGDGRSPLGHSPIAPSPLGLPALPESRGRTDHIRARRQSMDDSQDNRLSLGLSHLSVEARRRRSSYSQSDPRIRAPSAHDTATGQPVPDRRPGMGRRKSSLRPVPGSVSDSEEVRTRLSSVRQRSTSRLRRRSREDTDIHSERDRHEGRGEGGQRPRRTASIRKGPEPSDRHNRENRQEVEEEESPYHRPHLPIDHSPLLAPHSGTEYAPSENGGHGHRPRRQSQQDNHHHHQRHHQTSRAQQHENDDFAQNHQRHRHRRTLSEQGYGDKPYFPPPHAGTLYPGQSASVAGFDQHPHPQHHHPTTTGSRRLPDQRQPFPQQIDGGQSVHPPANGMGLERDMGVAYDDGASAAVTAMTFMDGPIGGRVSQYGLPKYAHNPKVDYRRFCVQRGNADVFLD